MMNTANKSNRDGSTSGVSPRTLCVIPARGGSQRIPRKNIRELCGRPMIAWTIDAALACRCIGRTLVSTDDPETAKIATSCGAEVPFVRGDTISDAQTPVSIVAVDALARIDPSGRLFDSVVMLLPNCPLRTAEDIEHAYHQFVETDADSQLSVTRFGWQNPWWAMKRDESQELSMLFPQHAVTRSQDLPGLFCPSGAVWWIKPEVLRHNETFHIDGRTGCEMPWQHGVDIDNEDDWQLARLLMEQRLREGEA